jgi:uncharacterized membrane protein YraQ (UPF0718 family)
MGGFRVYNYVIYSLAIGLLGLSWFKDQKKTMIALKKAYKSVLNILPELLGIILIIGVILAVLDPPTISKLVGAESGPFGVIIIAIVGAITLIPGFIAFPTAAMLLENGAGTMQIAAFISTLMMVGVATAPLEIRYFGKKATIVRNVLAFLFSFVIAYIISLVVGA